jgi:hypothetical protein
MINELEHHAVPFSSDRVLSAIFPVWSQMQNVVEADILRRSVQKVHTESIETRVAGVVLAFMHHHKGTLLNNGGHSS